MSYICKKLETEKFNGMRQISMITFILAFLFLGFQEAEAQRTRSTSRSSSRTKKSDKPSFKDNLAYEIGIGNPGFSGQTGNTQIRLGLKPGVGYIVSQRFSPGIFAKTDYLFVNQFGTRFNLFDYGIGAFAKFKIVESIYLRGEYALQSYAFNRTTGNLGRSTFTEFLVGGGYKNVNPGSNWSWGGELLFHLNEDVRVVAGQIFEFWIKVDYKF